VTPEQAFDPAADDTERPDLFWAPERPIFMRRLMMLTALTLLGLVMVGIWTSLSQGWPLIWVWPTAAVLTLGFLFDDVTNWGQARLNRWQLTPHALHHHGPSGTTLIPLSDITQAQTRFGTRVIVRLKAGTRVELRYLRFAAQVADQINAALPRPAA